MMKRIVLLTALAAGLALPAFAQSADTPRYTVTYSDRSASNLENPALLLDGGFDTAESQHRDTSVDEPRGRGLFAQLFSGNATSN